jgi:O-6-methylguanine DNA methyltransferase
MDVENLRERWTHLYREHLPALAKARDPGQKQWPVHLDHCFARIILDNVVGADKPWTDVVKAPAVKNMSSEQLQAAIGLGEEIATGKANLVELDEWSLSLRGKQSKNKKRKREDDSSGIQASKAKSEPRSTGTISGYFLPSPTSPAKEAKSERDMPHGNEQPPEHKPEQQSDEVDIPYQLKRIADSDITAFRKQMLSLLCEVPRGRYSTYQTMADYITKTSHKTCARAVGNAMRNNPFAPEVPCHRILAHDGSLGGFKGSWGENGKFASHKHKLLHEEGVRFDSRGKVKGPPFRDFKG